MIFHEVTGAGVSNTTTTTTTGLLTIPKRAT